MRKTLALTLAAALTFAVVGAGQFASAENIQSINGKIRPNKLYKKKKRRTVSLFVNVSTTNPSNPFNVPSPTTLAKVDFDKDIKIQNKGLDTCNYNLFTASTTTNQAQNLCGSSKVGGGASTIAVPTGPATPPLFVNATVTAFNATHTRLALHTYNQLSGATTLLGKVRHDKQSGKKYGQTLIVPVPPLAGGTAVITQFNTRVKKAYKYKHKSKALVSATCKDKKIFFQARFTYKDGTSDDAVYKQKCKQKPLPKH